MGHKQERFVMVGVSGGYRIRNNKTKRFWGPLFTKQPDELKKELNKSGISDPEILNRLVQKYK